jgi:hypothetical protein
MKYILRRQEQKVQLSSLSVGDVDSNTASRDSLDILQVTWTTISRLALYARLILTE